MLQRFHLKKLHLRKSCQDSAGQEADWTDVVVTAALKTILKRVL